MPDYNIQVVHYYDYDGSAPGEAVKAFLESLITADVDNLGLGGCSRWITLDRDEIPRYRDNMVEECYSPEGIADVLVWLAALPYMEHGAISLCISDESLVSSFNRRGG